MKFVKTLLIGAIITLPYALKAEELVNANFRNLDLKQFVDMIGKITGKGVLIHGQLNGKVNFVSRKPIKKSSLFALANSILAEKGYALIDHGDFLEVVKASEAAAMGVPVEKGTIKGHTMQTVLFPLKYSNAAVVRAKIRPLLPRNAKAISFRNNNILAVTAYPETLKTIKKLIEDIESSNQRGTTIIKLKNALAKDIYPNLQNIAKILFPQTIPSEKVGVLKDDATNSIILVGKKENVDKLLTYVKKLDRKGETISQKLYVIPLKNSDVGEMEKILSKLVAQMNNLPPTNPAAKGAKGKVSKAMVVGDKERNALIVLANAEQIKNIKEVIRKIDVAKPQVYVRAKIVEINTAKARNVGLKYGFEGGKITAKGLFSMAGNMGSPSLMVSKTILGFLSTEKEVPDGSGGYKIIHENPFSFGSDIKELFALGIKLDLLQQHGAAHILSEPSILCSNNEEAEIYVGETRSILVSSSVGDTKDAVVRNKYSREDIGISLKVKPRISSTNKVALKVEAVIEDVVPGSGSNVDRPTTTKRKVTTKAIVNNGQTVILGGLMKSSGGKSVSKIPILGDIPILGALFTSKSYTQSKINVVVYLTPYIIRKSSDLTKLREFLSDLDNIQARYSAYIRRKLAQRSGISYQDIPQKGIKVPAKSSIRRVEDPLSVLDSRP